MIEQPEIHRKSLSKKAEERKEAADALRYNFANLDDKKQAWDDLYKLTQDGNSDVRWRAAYALGSAYFHIPDEHKKQAWEDLHKFTQDVNYDVRWGAAHALGSAYSSIPDKHKQQAWDDLHRLTQDSETFVRIYANHSMGRVCIFKATRARNKRVYRKELEKALEFFEKSSRESSIFNPARFCLPFYRSFHAITSKKLEADVDTYLAEARKAVEGSESKEKLLEAVKNLSNAIKEAQKTRDFNEQKRTLGTYRQYCENAACLLDTTEGRAPIATELIRMGLPIIDEKIKEIQEKAKELCKKTRGTEYETLGEKINRAGQAFSKVRDQSGLEKSVNNMLDVYSDECRKLSKDEKPIVCKLIKKAKKEQYLDDKMNLLNIITVKFTSHIGQKETTTAEKRPKNKRRKTKPSTLPYTDIFFAELSDTFSSLYQKDVKPESEKKSKTLEYLKHILFALTTDGKEVNWLDVGCGNGRLWDRIKWGTSLTNYARHHCRLKQY